jgi:ACT domain-containing protein
MEDVTSVVDLDIILMSAQNIIDVKIINTVDIQNQRRQKIKKSKIRPHKSSYKYKNHHKQLNSIETTNSYAASTFLKDYSTEDTSFIGCISTEAKTVSSPNNHLEDVNSTKVSIWIIDSGASLHVTNSINLLKNINIYNENRSFTQW